MDTLMRTLTPWILVSFALALAGCGHDPPAGSGTVEGSVEGEVFDTVHASYVIGKPDDPSKTIVVYVFDTPIGCDELSRPAWDERIADRTHALELKLIGKTTGDYPVATDALPSAGQSDVNYTLTSTTATPVEISANGGSVRLMAYGAGANASGEFDLVLPGGTLKGTFDAAWCAEGREP